MKAWAALGVAFLMGCGTRDRGGADGGVAVVGSGAGAASPPAPRPASRRLTDPRWLRAKGDDEADLIRLAQAVGADELVEGVDDGGEVAKVAFAALPHAADADLALGPLATRLIAASGAGRTQLLEAMAAIAARPRDQRDPLDPEGGRAAAKALIAVGGDAKATPEDRALAITGARALAERGFIAAASVPSP